MLSTVKQLLKTNRFTHRVARRVRNLFQPAYYVEELTAAWAESLVSLDLPRAYAIYNQSRAWQQRLAATLPPGARPVRCLSDQWSAHIGHIAHLDTYVKIGLLGWRPSEQAVLLAEPRRIANPFYLDHWKPYLSIISDPKTIATLWYPAHVNEDYVYILDVRGEPLWFPFACSVAQRAWSEQGRPPLLSLDAATREKGWRVLQSLGMPRNAWFVGMHVRESGFRRGDPFCAIDISRDADIDTYARAMRAITQRGGWVIRCGDPSMKPMPPAPQMIDYAHSQVRSDWMDVFLCSQARFFIGTQSGLSHVPSTYGVPTLYTNWVSWGFMPSYPTDYVLPKLLWSEAHERSLTLAEILADNLRNSQHAHHFVARRVTPCENSPSEIEDAVIELMDRLEATPPAQSHPRLTDHIRECYRAAGSVLNAQFMNGFLERHANLFAPV